MSCREVSKEERPISLNSAVLVRIRRVVVRLVLYSSIADVLEDIFSLVPEAVVQSRMEWADRSGRKDDGSLNGAQSDSARDIARPG
jgi:hypothetical protein